jgi:hypothetical protein
VIQHLPHNYNALGFNQQNWKKKKEKPHMSLITLHYTLSSPHSPALTLGLGWSCFFFFLLLEYILKAASLGALRKGKKKKACIHFFTSFFFHFFASLQVIKLHSVL